MKTRVLLFFIFMGLTINTVFSQSVVKANKKFELGDFSGALKIYLKICQNNPQDIYAISKIAKCYGNLNLNQEAIKYYKLLGESNINNDERLQYAHVLKSSSKFVDAINEYSKLTKSYEVLGGHFSNSCNYALKNKIGTKSVLKVTNFSTETSDFSPAVFNGELVYASNRADLNRKFGKNRSKESSLFNQLFLVKDGNVSLLKSDIANEWNEAPLAFSADSKWVAFTKNKFKPGTKQFVKDYDEVNIFIGEVNDNGEWVNIKPFPFNVEEYSCTYPAFSENGNVLYYSSNQPNGYGGFDIYMSKKVDNIWTLPVNLGNVINAFGNEIAPYVFNGDLYFSSDWHYGYGGFDLFSAHKTGSSIYVKNLGAEINSSKDDYDVCFLPDGRAYFTTNRIGTLGFEDVYSFNYKDLANFETNEYVHLDDKISNNIKKDVVVSNDENSYTEVEIKHNVKQTYDNEIESKNIDSNENGFAIQLASYNYQNQVVDRSIFKSVSEKGNLYDRISGNTLKVKLGIFKTEDEARLKLDEVRQLGFEEAFITPEKVKGLMDKVLTSMNDKYVLKGEPKFGVRLAAYSKESSFDSYKTKVSKVGKYKIIKKGKWFIVYIVDVENENEASKIVPTMQDIGFKEAYIVSLNEMGHYMKVDK